MIRKGRKDFFQLEKKYTGLFTLALRLCGKNLFSLSNQSDALNRKFCKLTSKTVLRAKRTCRKVEK